MDKTNKEQNSKFINELFDEIENDLEDDKFICTYKTVNQATKITVYKSRLLTDPDKFRMILTKQLVSVAILKAKRNTKKELIKLIKNH